MALDAATLARVVAFRQEILCFHLFWYKKETGHKEAYDIMLKMNDKVGSKVHCHFNQCDTNKSSIIKLW